MSEQIVVVGIGSPHGADQAGWQVVERLSLRPAITPLLGNALRLIVLDRPASGLLEFFEGAVEVHLIDAMLSGGEVGTWRTLTSAEAMNDSPLVSSHGFGVGQALQLAEAMHKLPERLYVHAVEVPESLELSARLEVALDALVDHLECKLLKTVAETF